VWKIPAVAAIAKAHGVSGAQVAISHLPSFSVQPQRHTRYSAQCTPHSVTLRTLNDALLCLFLFSYILPQVALKWLVQQEISAVTAANNATYIREDVDLWSFQLTAAEMDTLAAI
jgi:diketogulonate reductase-like aldo/keto reductase